MILPRVARLLLPAALVAGVLALPVAASSEDPSRAPRPVPAMSGAAGGVLRLAPVDGGLAARDVPLDDARLARPIRTDGFDMLGLTWRGESPAIRVRTHDGTRWGTWQRPELLADGPDASSPERRGVTGTDLLWAGGAERVQVDVLGPAPADLTLALLEVPRETTTTRTAVAPAGARNTFKPAALGRRAWGADESLRSGRPIRNRTVQQVHVHHTVNSNDYAPGDVPGLIRGMYRYHTQNLGWSDLGYNALVDRFGRLWAGRAGGLANPVRGAHTLGFNNTGAGVAVIGNFETGKPNKRVITALVQYSAWRLNRYGRNPAGSTKVFSHGSDRYRYGSKPRLPVIDGHRDTSQTACPGEALYAKLPVIRQRAAARIARYR